MSNSADEPASFSFPTFHKRPTELSANDVSRIELASVVRSLVLESFTSTADAQDVDDARALVVQAVALLKKKTGDAGSAAAESHFSDRSPFYGAMNPLSMPMRLEINESIGDFGAVSGIAVFTEPYEGPPGHVHGGFVAAGFDEVLGMAQSLTGRPGMTGKLNVTYRAPTPLHTEITFLGWVERVEGRKIFTKATAHNGETLCSEAEGIFLSMPAEMVGLLKKGRDLSGPQAGALQEVIEKGRELT